MFMGLGPCDGMFLAGEGSNTPGIAPIIKKNFVWHRVTSSIGQGRGEHWLHKASACCCYLLLKRSCAVVMRSTKRL